MNTAPPSHATRRSFLRNSVAVVPLVALAQPTPNPGSTQPGTYQPAFFHPAEWAFVKAAVARLVPSDSTGPGALETGVPEFIDRQMDALFGHASRWYMQGPFVESPPEFGYQSMLAPRDVYRLGIAATDAYCKASLGAESFARLSTSAQDQLLQGMESGSVVLAGVSAQTFFGFLLQNTKEGYLSDPLHGGNKDAAAWKMIGFPGARADYADWVGRPGERYPLPPVSILGTQG